MECEDLPHVDRVNADSLLGSEPGADCTGWEQGCERGLDVLISTSTRNGVSVCDGIVPIGKCFCKSVETLLALNYVKFIYTILAQICIVFKD